MMFTFHKEKHHEQCPHIKSECQLNVHFNKYKMFTKHFSFETAIVLENRRRKKNEDKTTITIESIDTAHSLYDNYYAIQFLEN